MTKQVKNLIVCVQSVASEGDKLPIAERRNFLKQGLTMLGAAGVARRWR